jgi:CheY-like chemotaxis protein
MYRGTAPPSEAAHGDTLGAPMSTILLVDDDPHLREVVRYALARQGYVVREARTGAEALRALVDQGRIDGLTANAAAVEALLSGWSKEPGHTLADIINAVTRAAHEAKFGLDKQEKIEKSAGELVPILVRSAQRALA